MGYFCLLPRVVRGRVPKAWFDIWDSGLALLKPTLEN